MQLTERQRRAIERDNSLTFHFHPPSFASLIGQPIGKFLDPGINPRPDPVLNRDLPAQTLIAA